MFSSVYNNCISIIPWSFTGKTFQQKLPSQSSTSSKFKQGVSRLSAYFSQLYQGALGQLRTIKGSTEKAYYALVDNIVPLSVLAVVTAAVLYAAMGPLSSLLATHISSFSLFEFYLIYLMLRKPVDKIDNVNLSTFKNFGIHIASDLYRSAILVAKLGFIVLSAPYVFTALGFLSVSTLSMVSFPIGLYLSIKTLLGLELVLFFISLFNGQALYQYIGFAPLVCSVLFAVLTDMAATAVAVNTVFAASLYFISILPLMFFAYEAYERYQNSSAITDLPFVIGLTSLSIHIIEALCMVGGTAFFCPPLLSVARFITSNKVQAPLLALTTGSAMVKVTEHFSNACEGA